MTAAAIVIRLAVIGLAFYAIRIRPEAHSRRQANLLIIGGGAVIPTVVLTGLLAYGLALMPDLLAPAPEGSLEIAVTGEQWWWRVRYLPLGGNGGVAELANEIRLPVGERVEFHLESPDVIHSFWIPALGGKIDMIPGRRNRLALEPTRTGVFRGTCAEYCGTSHALMRFDVVVLEQVDFAIWAEAVALLAARGLRLQESGDGKAPCPKDKEQPDERPKPVVGKGFYMPDTRRASHPR